MIDAQVQQGVVELAERTQRPQVVGGVHRLRALLEVATSSALGPCRVSFAMRVASSHSNRTWRYCRKFGPTSGASGLRVTPVRAPACSESEAPPAISLARAMMASLNFERG